MQITRASIDRGDLLPSNVSQCTSTTDSQELTSIEFCCTQVSTHWVSSNLSWFASLNNKALGNIFCNPEKSYHTSPAYLQKILGFFVNANAIVEFEEWSIASIIRVGRSRRGVKTLLWITEYITKSFVIHYEGFELSHCVYYKSADTHYYLTLTAVVTSWQSLLYSFTMASVKGLLIWTSHLKLIESVMCEWKIPKTRWRDFLTWDLLLSHFIPFLTIRSHFCDSLLTQWFIWRAHFQKGNPLLVEIELLVEHSRVSKTIHFDTNFMSLAYSCPELWSSAISGKFWIFEQNWPFVSKNNVNLTIFFTEKIYIWFNFYSEISKLRKFVFFSKLTFLTEKKNKHNS